MVFMVYLVSLNPPAEKKKAGGSGTVGTLAIFNLQTVCSSAVVNRFGRFQWLWVHSQSRDAQWRGNPSSISFWNAVGGYQSNKTENIDTNIDNFRHR